MSSSMEKFFPARIHVLNRAVLAVLEFSSTALFQASTTQSGISLASGFFSFLGTGVSLDGPIDFRNTDITCAASIAYAEGFCFVLTTPLHKQKNRNLLCISSWGISPLELGLVSCSFIIGLWNHWRHLELGYPYRLHGKWETSAFAINEKPCHGCSIEFD